MPRNVEKLEQLENAQEWLESVNWHLSKNGLDAEIVIKVSGSQDYSLLLSFPEYYPSAPPSIRPRNEERLSGHQFGAGGELCLELGPDNWNGEHHRAADLVESAYKLLLLESASSTEQKVAIPSRHKVTQGQAHRQDTFRLILSNSAKEILDSIPSAENFRCSISTIYFDGAVRIFLREIEAEFDKEKNWSDAGIPKALHKRAFRGSGLIVGRPLDNSDIAGLAKPEALADFTNTLQIRDFHEAERSNERADIEYVLVRNSSNEWKLYCRWDSGTKSMECAIVISDSTDFESRSGVDTGLLSQKVVAIVGLGSAGSKIATSLARSGVRKFLLVDDDLLHPSNLVRHDNDWSQVGQHKVEAAAAKLRLIHADIEVVTRKHQLGGQESSSSERSVLRALGDSHLIIDATANPRVFNLCAHVAKHSETAMFWLEVYAGGIGGLIARARPGKDPEPFSQRDAILEACNKLTEEKGVDPPTQAADYSGLYDDNFLVASDADVSVIASYLDQMVVDYLSESEPSRFHYSAYLIGMARGWIFDQAMQVNPIQSSTPLDWSSKRDMADSKTKDGLEFATQLFKEFSQDDDNSTST